MNIYGAYYTSDFNLAIGSIVQLVPEKEKFVMAANETSEYLNTFTINTDILFTKVYKNFTLLASQSTPGVLSIFCYQDDRLLWRNTISTFKLLHASMVVGLSGVYLNIKGCGRWFVGNKLIISNSKEYTTIVQLDLNTGDFITFGYYENLMVSKLTLNVSTSVPYLYGYTSGAAFFSDVVEPIIDIDENYSFLIQLGQAMNPVDILTVIDSVTTFLGADGAFISSIQIDDSNQTTLDTINTITGDTWSVIIPGTVVNFIMNVQNIVILVKDGLNASYKINIYVTDSGNVAPVPNIIDIDFGGDLLESCFTFNETAFLYLYALTFNNTTGYTFLKEYIGVSGVFVWETLVPNNPLTLSCDASYNVVGYSREAYRFGIKWPFTLGVISEILWPLENPPCSNGYYLNPSDCCGTSGTCVAIPPSSPPYEIVFVFKVDFLITEAFFNNPNITVPIIPGAEYYIDANANLTLNSIGNDFFGTALDAKRIYMVRNGATL
jgi:hypothetical protein